MHNVRVALIRTSALRRMIIGDRSKTSVRCVTMRARSDATPAIYDDHRPPSHIPNIVTISSFLLAIRASCSSCLSKVSSHHSSTLVLSRYWYWNSFYSCNGHIARSLERERNATTSFGPADVAFTLKPNGNRLSILIGCTRSHYRAVCNLSSNNQLPDHYLILKIRDVPSGSTANIKSSMIILLNHTCIAL
jgi:hypothetical protein